MTSGVWLLIFLVESTHNFQWIIFLENPQNPKVMVSSAEIVMKYRKTNKQKTLPINKLFKIISFSAKLFFHSPQDFLYWFFPPLENAIFQVAKLYHEDKKLVYIQWGL